MSEFQDNDKPYMIITAGDAASLHLSLKTAIMLAEKHTPDRGGDRTKISLLKKALLIFDDPQFVMKEPK